MNVYFVSGLGADQRIFSKLNLNEQFKAIHLDWVDFDKGDTLKSYALKMSRSIDTSKPFAIIGVSFGGMIATEMALNLKPKATIAISSIINSSQLPLLYRFAGKLRLLKLIPSKVLKSSNKLTQNYYFGTKLKEERELLSRIINDTDPRFLKSAIELILSWKNRTKPEKIHHIHGSNDKIFPIKKLEPDFVIENGTHFMVYQNAEEISGIINKLLL